MHRIMNRSIQTGGLAKLSAFQKMGKPQKACIIREYTRLRAKNDDIPSRIPTYTQVNNYHAFSTRAGFIGNCKDLNRKRGFNTNLVGYQNGFTQIQTRRFCIGNNKKLLVIGCCTIDIISRISDTRNANLSKDGGALKPTSYIGKVQSFIGGVGQNISRAAHLAGADVYLVAMVGGDPFANTIKSELEKINMNTEYLLSNPDYGSAVYNTIHNYDGDLVAGVADMDVVEQLTPSQASDVIVKIQPKNVVFDGNITYATMAEITETCSNLGIPTFFEPTSLPKSLRLIEAINHNRASVDCITPNFSELEIMAKHAIDTGLIKEDVENIDYYCEKYPEFSRELITRSLQVIKLFPTILITMGSKGVVIATSAFGPNTNTNQNVGSNGSQSETPDIIFKSIPALTPPSEIVNTNGAGDSFMGGLMAQLSRSDYNFKNTENKLPLEKLCEFVQKAQRASIKSLQSECAVNSDITPELFD